MKHGDGVIIFGVVIYCLFMGYLADAAGYTPTQIQGFMDISLPGPLALLTPVVWVVGSMVSFFGLMAFNISGGDVPIWVNAFAFTPMVFMLGWMILSMVRG
jgi:hypothetical protein